MDTDEDTSTPNFHEDRPLTENENDTVEMFQNDTFARSLPPALLLDSLPTIHSNTMESKQDTLLSDPFIKPCIREGLQGNEMTDVNKRSTIPSSLSNDRNEHCTAKNRPKTPAEGPQHLDVHTMDDSNFLMHSTHRDDVVWEHGILSPSLIKHDSIESFIRDTYMDAEDDQESDENPDECGIIAIGIPTKAGSNYISDENTILMDGEEKEEEELLPSSQDADQLAISAIVALNVAELEHNNTKKSKKIVTDDGVPMIAMIRNPTTEIAHKEATNATGVDMSFARSTSIYTDKKKSGEGSFKRSGDVGAIKSQTTCTQLSLASPLPAKSERTNDEAVRSPIYGFRATQGLLDSFISDSSEDENDDLEAQAGIPVVLPGAFAMIGMDNEIGRQITGYDSGFDGDDSDAASSGILEPPPLPEEEQHPQVFEQEEESMTAADHSLVVEGIEAELHEEHEEIFVEGQVFIGETEVIETVPVWYNSRFFKVFFVSAIAGTAAIVSAVTITNSHNNGSNLREATSTSLSGHDGWNILGSDLVGPTDDNQNLFGQSISLSSNGQRLVVGVPGFDASIRDIKVGQARVYDWNGTTWEMFAAINGPSMGSQAGSSVALSKDGRRTAIGSPGWANGIGQVSVYDEPPTGSNATKWIEVREAILGNFTKGESPSFGTSVGLSWDGTIVAVAAPFAERTIGTNVGVVRVYHENNSIWNQQGSDLEGEIVSGVFGLSLSLSSSGARIAIGGPSGVGSKVGLVKVFDFIGSDWTNVGQTLTATDEASTCFGYAVSLSDDGSVLAIAASGPEPNLGLVQVYRIVDDRWTQIGGAMGGSSQSNAFLGQSLSLSSGGDVIAIGSPKGDGLVAGSGKINVFKYDGNSWSQAHGDIRGSAEGDAFGSSVAISGSGKIIAGGAPNFNFDGIQGNEGRVQIYQIEQEST
jgi:hypothetical protein